MDKNENFQTENYLKGISIIFFLFVLFSSCVSLSDNEFQDQYKSKNFQDQSNYKNFEEVVMYESGVAKISIKKYYHTDSIPTRLTLTNISSQEIQNAKLNLKVIKDEAIICNELFEFKNLIDSAGKDLSHELPGNLNDLKIEFFFTELNSLQPNYSGMYEGEIKLMNNGKNMLASAAIPAVVDYKRNLTILVVDSLSPISKIQIFITEDSIYFGSVFDQNGDKKWTIDTTKIIMINTTKSPGSISMDSVELEPIDNTNATLMVTFTGDKK